MIVYFHSCRCCVTFANILFLGLIRKISLNKNVDDEAIRSPKNYTVNINDLVKVLDKNKDKILNIEYKIDEEIA